MMPLDRKSIEPLAAHLDPGHVRARHQSLHHFVAKSEWSDAAVLARARRRSAAPHQRRGGPAHARRRVDHRSRVPIRFRQPGLPWADRLRRRGTHRSLGCHARLVEAHTGLSCLRGLAIDTVKIDKSFVDGIEHNVDDEVLTSTIVLMAHSLGLSVVAEGVETERQLTFLRGENCDEIQGYWLARALEADACRQFVAGYRMPKGLVLPGAG